MGKRVCVGDPCSLSASGNLGTKKEGCALLKEGAIVGGPLHCWISSDSYFPTLSKETLLHSFVRGVGGCTSGHFYLDTCELRKSTG